ncbi:hypothetical protein J5S49_13570 [Virgibacillus halodenitrificans]|uniref:hypothetical protein n=1 Tax=Virgibacillus halodenitrificans TaxID=1482 RepID=UPI001F3DE667|nr:hypothetical protein [Virgibacillus halodenitrificans]MCG1029321.1 hypothetical protein [Virgibacillus halodenitrificans]
MNTLIIYDNEGYILSIRQGEPAPREPIGVPFLWVDIPEGKRIKVIDGIGVDTSVTPHEVILEDIPPSEVDVLEIQVADLQYQLMMNGVL